VTRISRGRSAVAAFALLVVIGAAAFLWLTRPRPLAATALPDLTPDPSRGEVLFHAGSCGSCHRAADGAAGAAEGLPAGSAALATPVGTFYPGNLTPDPETGIGRWSEIDFVNAMSRGLSPDGAHYFPVFPYTSYATMPIEDVLDLHAYLMSLPPVHSPARGPDVPILGLARRGVGLWKRMALDTRRFEPDPARSESWNRGAYLTNGPGHCGECHTPRNWMMIPDRSRHMAGGPHPAEEGDVPSLRGLLARKRYKDVGDLTLALQYGETFGYDKLSSGGMADIQMNLAKLPQSDVGAISEYLLSLN
jgi:mono/diheme cytochrome c family protein